MRSCVVLAATVGGLLLVAQPANAAPLAPFQCVNWVAPDSQGNWGSMGYCLAYDSSTGSWQAGVQWNGAGTSRAGRVELKRSSGGSCNEHLANSAPKVLWRGSGAAKTDWAPYWALGTYCVLWWWEIPEGSGQWDSMPQWFTFS